jgi:hypothetical protein
MFANIHACMHSWLQNLSDITLNIQTISSFVGKRKVIFAELAKVYNLPLIKSNLPVSTVKELSSENWKQKFSNVSQFI